MENQGSGSKENGRDELRRNRLDRRQFIRMVTAASLSASAACSLAGSARAETGGQEVESTGKAGHTLILDPAKCTGCMICAITCADKYMQEYAPEEAKNTINLEYARIRPMRFQYVDFVNVCQYCELIKWAEGKEQHPCQAVCPTGAIQTVPQGQGKKGYYGMGYMNIDRRKCLGIDHCGRCLEVCEEQFGSGISFDPIERKAQVCSRCGGDPACVKACPEPGALQFIPVQVNGRYYAHNPDEAAELLYMKMFNKKRDL